MGLNQVSERWSELWGLGGVLVLLLIAVYRLMPAMGDIVSGQNGLKSYLALSVLVPIMIYLEGYRGFYKRFTPRVISRGKVLKTQTQLVYQLLAPVFCMGFIGSTLLRKLGLFIVTLCIFGLVIDVKSLPQPWRWVIDLSVAVALCFGALSIVCMAYRDWGNESLRCDPGLPRVSGPLPNCKCQEIV